MASKQEGTRRGVHQEADDAMHRVRRPRPASAQLEVREFPLASLSVQAYIPIGISPACRNIRRYVDA